MGPGSTAFLPHALSHAATADDASLIAARVGTRRPLIALLLLALSMVLGCQSDEEKIAGFLDRGAAYVEEGKFREAIIEYRNVVQIDPNHPEAHYALAKAYIETKKLKEAFWELSESIRLDPQNVEARLSYGALLLIAKDWEQVLAQSESIMELDDRLPGAYLLRGQALEGLERGDEAEADYRKAVEVGPEEVAHLLILASYLARNDRNEEAEEVLFRYAEIDPGFDSYTSLGRFQARNNWDLDGAEESFRNAVEKSDENEKVAAYKNLSGYLFQRNKPDQAVAVLEEGIEEAEENLELLYVLASYYRSMGEEEKASALLQEATRAQPGSATPFLTLSAYRGRQGDLEGALEAAEEALAAEPANLKAKLRKAELLVDMGYRAKDENKISQGREIVEGVLADEPTNPDALFVRAKTELAEGNPAATVESLRAALDSRPDWPQAHFVLGSALALQGDNKGARGELARAVELDPTLLDARRVLAKLHVALGEHEYAIEQGRIFLRERPDDVELRILVAQSLVRIGKRDEANAEMEMVPEELRTAESDYAMARLAMSQGKLDEARTLLLRVNEKRPNEPDVLRSLLQVEQPLGKSAESIARIEAAAAAKPDDSGIAVLLGGVAQLQGDGEKAKKALNRATELDPKNVSAYEQLASIHQREGRMDQAIATYAKALEARPNSAELHHRIGVLYEFERNTSKAIEHYERAIEIDDRMGQAKNNLAYLLAESGQTLDRALDLAQEAKALLPDSANAADTLGWVLFKRGVPSAAVGYLREAEAAVGENDTSISVIRHHLSQAYAANGEQAKAIETAEKAIAGHERVMKQLAAQGNTLPEPEWLAEARALLERLKS